MIMLNKKFSLSFHCHCHCHCHYGDNWGWFSETKLLTDNYGVYNVVFLKFIFAMLNIVMDLMVCALEQQLIAFAFTCKRMCS